MAPDTRPTARRRQHQRGKLQTNATRPQGPAPNLVNLPRFRQKRRPGTAGRKIDRGAEALLEAAERVVDVIVTCFNAGATVHAAVQSALAELSCASVIVVDDGSLDNSRKELERLKEEAGSRLRVVPLVLHQGAARARNLGARRVRSPFLAFLDAADCYERHALDTAATALAHLPSFAAMRLRLTPAGKPPPAANRPGFAERWRLLELTAGSNLVIRREVFEAAGGFPEEAALRRSGGEDEALARGLVQCCTVGTLFDQPGILASVRPGTHGERLLASPPDNPADTRIDEVRALASEAGYRIARNLEHLHPDLRGEAGTAPILITVRETIEPAQDKAPPTVVPAGEAVAALAYPPVTIPAQAITWTTNRIGGYRQMPWPGTDWRKG